MPRPYGVPELEILNRAGPIPARIIFVFRAVIAVIDIIGLQRLAAGHSAIHEILARIGVQHRHAQPRETEMVGAIIIAFLRGRFRLHGASLRFGGTGEIVLKL